MCTWGREGQTTVAGVTAGVGLDKAHPAKNIKAKRSEIAFTFPLPGTNV